MSLTEISPSYLLYGMPCAGKTTVTRAINAETGAIPFSFGNLVRAEKKQRTPFGQIFSRVDMTGGDYPDDIVAALVERNIGQMIASGQGIIFDGYPMTQKEAVHFKGLMEDNTVRVAGIVLLEVPYDTLLARAQLRRICKDCLVQTFVQFPDEVAKCSDCEGELIQRTEDKPENFIRRYDYTTTAMQATLAALDVLKIPSVAIRGDRPREEVAQQVVTQMASLRRLL